jgi:hypothetical protein
MFAEAGKAGHGTGTWYRWYWANRATGFSGGQLLPFVRDLVLTEDGTATFGYFANSAGVGGSHVLVERTIDGYLAIGCF